MKQCTKCKIFKEYREFNLKKSAKDGVRSHCILCRKNDYQNNKIKILKKAKIYRQNNKIKIAKRKKEHHKKYPLKRIFMQIKDRCNNTKRKDYKYYGGRGIQCLITEKEIKKLWFRDKAYLMKRPSIDRRDNDGDYCLENCRFIEQSLNSKKDKYKPILQYSLEYKFIKEWFSIKKATEELRINRTSISCCLKNKYKTAGGFIWKYKK